MKILGGQAKAVMLQGGPDRMLEKNGCLILALSVFFYLADCPAAEEGLVGYWKFDEGEKEIARDSSGKGNDGKIYGAAWVEGKVGKALSFDGKGYVDCGNDISLDLTKDFTIELWAYFKDTNPQGLVGRGLTGSSGYLAYSGWGTLYLRLFSSAGENKSISKTTQVTANGGQVSGKWSHLVFVREEKMGQIYSDGVDITASRDILTGPKSNSEKLYIGCAQLPQLYNTNGFLDEVKVYNRALSVEDVKESFVGSAKKGETEVIKEKKRLEEDLW